MATAGATGGYYRDPQLEEITKTFKPMLVEFLSPKTGFLTGLNAFLNRENLDEIQSLEGNGKRQDAVCRLLDILSDCEQPGVCAAFIHSLKSNKMDHLAEMIEKGHGLSERVYLNKFLIETFLPELVKVNPTDMLPYLPCLTDEEREEILNIQDKYSSDRAAMKLLLCLGLHGEEWLGQLIDALRKTRHRRLASTLAVMAGIQSEGVNPKTFASESQEAEDFLKCTAVNKSTERLRCRKKSFDKDRLICDCGRSFKNGQVLDLHRSKMGCKAVNSGSQDGEKYTSLDPDEVGTFENIYTSLSSNHDNLVDFDDDDQTSGYFEDYDEQNEDDEGYEDDEELDEDGGNDELTEKRYLDRVYQWNPSASNIGLEHKVDPEVKRQSSKVKSASAVRERRAKSVPTMNETKQNVRPQGNTGRRSAGNLVIPNVRRHPEQIQNTSPTGSAKSSNQMTSKPKVKTGPKPKQCSEEVNTNPRKSAIFKQSNNTANESTNATEIKPSSNSISGQVVNVDVKWMGNCCKSCTKSDTCKTVGRKKALVCKSCGDKHIDDTELVQRLVADITLKIKGNQRVTKSCHWREFKIFFKSNGDAVSNFRKKDEFKRYLELKKNLRFQLDKKGDVSEITKC